MSGYREYKLNILTNYKDIYKRLKKEDFQLNFVEYVILKIDIKFMDVLFEINDVSEEQILEAIEDNVQFIQGAAGVSYSGKIVKIMDYYDESPDPFGLLKYIIESNPNKTIVLFSIDIDTFNEEMIDTLNEIGFDRAEKQLNNKISIYYDPHNEGHDLRADIIAIVNSSNPLNKKTQQTLDLLWAPDVESTRASGNFFDLISGILYFAKKHSNICIILDENNYPAIDWECENKKRKLDFPVNFDAMFNKCKNSNKRFTIGFLTLKCLKGCNNCTTNDGHQNSFLYDKEDDSLELFEPYGSSVSEDDDFEANKLYSEFGSYFKKNYGIKNFYPPNSFCPSVGVQKMEEDVAGKLTDPFGFCIIWSLWWIDYRLSNPNVDRKTLIIESIKNYKKDPSQMKRFIRNYSEKVTKQIDNLVLKSNQDPNIKKKLDRVLELKKQLNVTFNKGEDPAKIQKELFDLLEELQDEYAKVVYKIVNLRRD